jgi:hypothetical protein
MLRSNIVGQKVALAADLVERRVAVIFANGGSVGTPRDSDHLSIARGHRGWRPY